MCYIFIRQQLTENLKTTTQQKEYIRCSNYHLKCQHYCHHRFIYVKRNSKCIKVHRTACVDTCHHTCHFICLWHMSTKYKITRQHGYYNCQKTCNKCPCCLWQCLSPQLKVAVKQHQRDSQWHCHTHKR